MNLNNITNYELVCKKDMPELYSEGYLLKHKKTGARVFILENDDNNKVFYIGFRTPPADSTGVPHITEHSVLCGSKKFPAKDPFVELAKGSLNTFLNAMTYPDKTVYPVASCNDTDFKNLMDVYMDAVLHPNIYSKEEIFKQEGWHYELNDPNGDLTINGVVYNEMKGAFSSAEDMVDRKIYEALYPDNAYSMESGGDPEVIPQLTYQAFLDFHQKYYHPSNSYIFLYGNCDMEERLNWLDNEYLSGYDYLEVDSKLTYQKPFEEMKELSFPYSITEDESLENNTFISYGCVIDTVLDKNLYLAYQILDYALVSAPGAPLKEALIKSGICEDVSSSYENGIYQPYFSILIKNANAEDKNKFLEIIKTTLGDIVKNGINRKALEAGINYYEFKYREADFGSYPKGLLYGLQSLDSWLYDDENPFLHLSSNSTFAFLKEQLNNRYFEEILEKYILKNTHSVLMISYPEKGLTGKKDALLAKKLAEIKAGFSDDELKRLCEETKALKRYQEEPDLPENLECIPLLKISDIKREAEPVKNEYVEKNGMQFLFHEVKSNGIGYLTLLFELDKIPVELYPYIGIFKNILGLVSTKNFTYGELINEINRKSGGVTFSIGHYGNVKDSEKFRKFFEIDAKLLEGESEFIFNIISEILFTSKFNDTERIKEIFKMLISRLQLSMASAGHSIASLRTTTYYSQRAVFSDMNSGYGFYKNLKAINEKYQTTPEEIYEKIIECMSYIFTQENLLIDYTGSREGLEDIIDRAAAFNKKLSDKCFEAVDMKLPLNKKNEAFKSSSQVQYVAMGGDYKKAGLEYSGAFKVLKTILSYDYLWINVRVKGGAYGCMNTFMRSGESFFVSYRDPNLSETLEVFKNIPAYIESFEVDERDMTKYIIGTISDMDVPHTPKMEGNRNLAIYLSEMDYDTIQKERDEVLSANQETIRSLSEQVKEIVNQNYICCIGSEEKVTSCANLFESVENLL